MNHVSQAKDRLKARLDAHLATVLAAADAEADDGFTTPPPAVILTFPSAGTQEYPSIEMVVQNSLKRAESVVDDYQHRVMLAVTVVGDDEETIVRNLERYMWALRKFGSDHIDRDMPDPNDAVDVIICGSEAYTPLLRGPSGGVEHPFVQGGFIEMLITTIE